MLPFVIAIFLISWCNLLSWKKLRFRKVGLGLNYIFYMAHFILKFVLGIIVKVVIGVNGKTENVLSLVEQDYEIKKKSI